MAIEFGTMMEVLNESIDQEDIGEVLNKLNQSDEFKTLKHICNQYDTVNGTHGYADSAVTTLFALAADMYALGRY